ncbi:heavy metal translocating P-type ATPase [Streptococcus halotolerans]|uniref:heavy metal translocating P-type ATPase n=1 Tax=Streptococcus halotolerans TaxID=1814128 RepID=UPI000787C485|nr:heavy metal translocating P-type ATPase [Streptococcus halotolerans]
MTGIILKLKKQLLIIMAILISLGFISHFVFEQHYFSQLLLLLASILGALPILIQAYQSLKIKVISIDILVSIAIIGAFLIQNYEESAMVAFLFLLGAFLEQRTLRKTRSAIKELLDLAPEKARLILDNGQIKEIASEDVEEGQNLLVRTGDKVPVDGQILSGSAYLNQASITGESDLLKKEVGDQVFAGSILENGSITIIAQKVGDDTVFGRIIELVEEAQDSKTDTEKFINSFSKYYTPLVLLLAFLTFIITKNTELAITILVLGCPGALVIGVPVSMVAGIGNGAKQGILFKGSEAMSTFSKADTILFDKTGTLTQGKPRVNAIETFTEVSKTQWSYLVSLEKESQHPLAQAILNDIAVEKTYNVEDLETIRGGGLSATIDQHTILVGNAWLMQEKQIKLPSQVQKNIHSLSQTGHSIVLYALDGQILLALGIKDALRPEAPQVIQSLRKQGFKQIAMLSGDQQETAELVAREAGIQTVMGNLLPQDKEKYIRQLQDKGHKVIFVGDGVNDSPSITRADLGIAMGSGTDVAMETADLILMQGNLTRLALAHRLSQATNRNMRENIAIALLVVAILLTGLLASDWVSMTVGMFVHEASILVVILNGMRLLTFGKSQKLDTYQGSQNKELVN